MRMPSPPANEDELERSVRRNTRGWQALEIWNSPALRRIRRHREGRTAKYFGGGPHSCAWSPGSEDTLQPTVHLRRNCEVIASGYLRAAQAYMLISMPTGTSTIFGAFQAIRVSQVVWRDVAPGLNLGPRRT